MRTDPRNEPKKNLIENIVVGIPPRLTNTQRSKWQQQRNLIIENKKSYEKIES